MEELMRLRNQIDKVLNYATENLGSEEVQPYIKMLEGLKNAINVNIDSLK